MRILRILGGLLVLLAVLALGYDFFYAGADAAGRLSALGEIWYRLHPGSLNLAQAGIQRHVSPWLWDPVIVTVLLWPAAAVIGGLGLLLLVLGSLRRR